jgi:ferritin-like metal-binding protein YciE
MKIMRDLFEKQLQAVYNSEVLILSGLPGMLGYAVDESLRDIIKTQIKATFDQKVRLEQIGKYLPVKYIKNDGMIIRGLLDEINELYAEFPKGILMDVGIISKIQHVQHFQISAYETAMLYAKKLDLDEVEAILEQTLDEVYEADEECSSYAKNLLLNTKGGKLNL